MGDRLVSKATQLVQNKTTNLSTNFRSVRCKMDGGKYINICMDISVPFESHDQCTGESCCKYSLSRRSALHTYLENTVRGTYALFWAIVIMVCFCCVPGCANRLNRDTGLLYFKLLPKRKSLNQWIHVIRRKNLPINNSTHVCSVHFINATARKLRPDEVPLEKLPLCSVTGKTNSQKPPKH